MISRTYIKRHKSIFAVIVFIILYLLIITLKPNFLYNNDGSLRKFGLGYRTTSVIPLWLIALVLGILSYLLVSYYIIYPLIK